MLLFHFPPKGWCFLLFNPTPNLLWSGSCSLIFTTHLEAPPPAIPASGWHIGYPWPALGLTAACSDCQRGCATERGNPGRHHRTESAGAGDTSNGLGQIASPWLCGHPCCQHDDVFLGRSWLWVCVGRIQVGSLYVVAGCQSFGVRLELGVLMLRVLLLP